MFNMAHVFLHTIIKHMFFSNSFNPFKNFRYCEVGWTDKVSTLPDIYVFIVIVSIVCFCVCACICMFFKMFDVRCPFRTWLFRILHSYLSFLVLMRVYPLANLFIPPRDIHLHLYLFNRLRCSKLRLQCYAKLIQ